MYFNKVSILRLRKRFVFIKLRLSLARVGFLLSQPPIKGSTENLFTLISAALTLLSAPSEIALTINSETEL